MNESSANRLVSSLFDDWYRSLLFYVCRLAASREDAEDVIQEAFLLLYRACRSGREIVNAKGWTLRVTRRLLWKRMREMASDRVVPGSAEWLDLLPSGTGDPEKPLLASEDDLWAALSILTPRELEVVLLRLEGLKYREIAGSLELTVSSVNTLLARAITKLQEALKEEKLERVRARYLEERDHPWTLQ
ncbi:MAG: sigma-70 family RNA polymerase sigma factor [Bryobacterales bacterium]|nr:sigma-70 family RNA polymerase sigma factor [Bryobacterales bacterium]